MKESHKSDTVDPTTPNWKRQNLFKLNCKRSEIKVNTGMRLLNSVITRQERRMSRKNSQFLVIVDLELLLAPCGRVGDVELQRINRETLDNAEEAIRESVLNH